MDPIYLLKEVGILGSCKTALDVGTKDGKIAQRLLSQGLQVDAIDIREIPEPINGICFERISIEDFLKTNKKDYDLVIARHVLHQVNDPIDIIRGMQEITKVLFFTCFGPKDDWAGMVTTLAHEEVLSMFKPESIRHHSEAFQYGKTYSGDMKYWHVNTFVIDNRRKST